MKGLNLRNNQSDGSSQRESPSASSNICVICMEHNSVRTGQALFTAECGHIFHFACIANNVRLGQSRTCPLCRAKWTQVPWLQSPQSSSAHPSHHAVQNRAPNIVPRDGSNSLPAVSNNSSPSYMDTLMRIWENIQIDPRRHRLPLPAVRHPTHHQGSSWDSRRYLHLQEQLLDDLDLPEASAAQLSFSACVSEQTAPADPAVPAAPTCYNVLMSLKAPDVSPDLESREPIDLVMVLDLSGSMTYLKKLPLVKDAVKFVLSVLSQRDRVSIVGFNSEGFLVTGLMRMDEAGREATVQRIDSLSASGGTDIGSGMTVAETVLRNRRAKNKVAAMMLLSDGQDDFRSPLGNRVGDDRGSTPENVPVHTFGFGADHDPTVLFAIGERTGGIFSFVENEAEIKEAFSQTIGGIMTVVAQDVQLSLTVSSGNAIVKKVRSRPAAIISPAGNMATAAVGDLYASEERNILAVVQAHDRSVIQLACSYLRSGAGSRPEREVLEVTVPVEGLVAFNQPTEMARRSLRKTLRRILTTDALEGAKSAADTQKFDEAMTILRRAVAELREASAADSVPDELTLSFILELSEMLNRLSNQTTYNSGGRSSMFSAIGSHTTERFSTRSPSYSRASPYQTPSMSRLLHQSQQGHSDSNR